MAALFYTNHRMGTVGGMFAVWRELAGQQMEERMRQQQSQKKNPVAAARLKQIQIDTDLANKEHFKNYQHLNGVFGSEMPSEIPNLDEKNHMIHIEGEDNVLNDDDITLEEKGLDEAQRDRQARKFLDDLMKVGPFAKQILNYSYPPLLYQRGDGDEEDEEDENDMEDDDDDAVRDILEGGAMENGVHQLPDFADDEDDMMDNADLAMGGMGNMIPPEDDEEGAGGSYPQIHGEDESEGDIEQLLKNADENELYRQI